MLVRPINISEKKAYDQVVGHPLQSWAWGEFKKSTGHQVERLGFFQNNHLVAGLQVTFSKLPGTKYQIGYCPRAFPPTTDQMTALKELGEKHQALYIKLEPNVATPATADTTANRNAFAPLHEILTQNEAQKGKALFTKYTFWLDLNPSEDELFARLNNKTRYNVRLALKKGVTIVEDSSLAGMEAYIKLMEETTKRQGFLNHNGDYFRQLHQAVEKTGMMHIFHAVYQDQILTSWVTFNFNGRFYYPYGASSNQHRAVMPNNLMMWEVIRFAKARGCQTFDMWGSLGPEPDTADPWYGFHRFKEGYGGELMEYIGTYDLVFDQSKYRLFNSLDRWRWKFLRLKQKVFK